MTCVSRKIENHDDDIGNCSFESQFKEYLEKGRLEEFFCSMHICEALWKKEPSLLQEPRGHTKNSGWKFQTQNRS